MNGKIRLAALLTALLMLFQTIALAEVVTTVDDYNALLESRIEQFVKGTPEVQYAILMALETDDQRGSMLALLSEDQCIALSNYIISLDPPVYKTVNFTHAGPFMPPVDVSGIARMRLMRTTVYSNGNTAVDHEAVYTSKVVSGNPKDGYKLRLETYVTGKTVVEEVEKSIPVDIVLVLDQSGSMDYDFNGNSTNNDTNRRQYALKQAVNTFIDSVADKYDPEDADHRIALVTFGSNASTLKGWTFVDATGKTQLHNSVNGLPAQIGSASTNTGAGMTAAQTLMNNLNYSGSNTQRQKVVVVFTDGEPTTNNAFSLSVANTAVDAAYNMKAAGATIYSVGIFSGAKPSVLYGTGCYVYDWGEWQLISTCSGNVGDKWNRDDVAAANRFMNYMSSNFPTANEMGIEENSGWYDYRYYSYYKITKNYTRESSSYYLTADNATDLKKIFQTISDNIQTGQSSIALGTETVVKDIVADSFQLPENAVTNGIKVYTSDYTVDKTWTAEKEVSLTVNVKGSTVSVTGFDFAKNYVNVDAQNGRDENDPSKAGTFYGRKLIIEIPIEVKSGFLGGNNVPTNGAGSGVYASSDATTPIETFTSPAVNVPIAPITVTAPDKNVYLMGNLTANALKADATVMCGGVKINLDPNAENYGLKPWQNAYVTITPSFEPADSTVLTGLTEDTSYTVGCTITPKTELSGEGVAEQKTGSKTGKINVFLPEVTYKDSKVKYLDPIDDLAVYHKGTTIGNGANLVSIAWKHGDTEAPADMGDAPALFYTYAYSPNGLATDGKVTSTQDVNVNVTFKIGNEDVTGHTTTVRQKCELSDVKCDHTSKSTSDLANKHDPEFVVHVYDVLTTLTITKEGMQDIDAGQSFLFKVTGDGLPTGGLLIAINGNGSETISGLTVGQTYTVTEVESWSWRYTAESKSVTLGASDNVVKIKNEREKQYWLDGDCYAQNVFNKQGNVQSE